MKKFNKKGFTLIEMLVVIAIIAILVAIIVPTISSATTKAAAATNAANLRSYAAEVAIVYLAGGEDSQSVTVADDGTVTVAGITAPKSKKCKKGSVDIAKDVDATVKYEGGEFVGYFNTYKISDFAGIAE